MRARSWILVLMGVGCGDDPATTPDAAPDATDYTLGDHPALALACSDTPADVYVLPTGLPPMDDSRRGDVFRCAKTEKLTLPEVKAKIDLDNATFPSAIQGTIHSGFWTYRVAYRSTRNTVGSSRAEGDSAAVLLVPAKPIEGGPLVVFGHGSVGIAEKCAPSRLDLSGETADKDWTAMMYRLAGYGYTVIAPDYNGFSYGQTPGYFNAEDEAHAVLDATRAAAKLLPSPPQKVVFVGHSQGGHAVLSAHSYAESYGMAGTLVGVATLAPFWSSMSTWAAATTAAAGLTTTKDSFAVFFAMQYAYAAGELRDGTGVSVFQAAKQTAARDLLLGDCYDHAGLQALGATPADIFDADYVNIVGGACALSFTPDCTAPAAATWKTRWQEDRPPVDPTGAPILMYFGGADNNVPPPRAACAKKKVTSDLALVAGPTTQIELCYNPMSTHRDTIRGSNFEYVNEWIAAKAGAGAAPAACTPFPATASCGAPPNDL